MKITLTIQIQASEMSMEEVLSAAKRSYKESIYHFAGQASGLKIEAEGGDGSKLEIELNARPS